MLKKKWLIIIGVIIIGLSGVIIFKISPQQPSKRNEQAAQIETPDNDGELVGTKIKVPGPDQEGFWELNVEKMAELGESGKMFKIIGKYIEKGIEVYWITADSGDINWKNQLITFQENVRFSTNAGKKISSEVFIWDTKHKQITAKENVTLLSPDLTVTTEQLNADHRMQKALFSGKTKVLYQR